MMTPFDCPRCGTVLTMSDRQGIEIDYCPQCRGVWLDRGELDKILERAAVMSGPGSAPAGIQDAAPGGFSTGAAPGGGWVRPAADHQPPPAYPQPPHYPPAQAYPPSAPHAGWRGRDGDDDWDDDRKLHRGQDYQGKRRKNWLSDLFD